MIRSKVKSWLIAIAILTLTSYLGNKAYVYTKELEKEVSTLSISLAKARGYIESLETINIQLMSEQALDLKARVEIYNRMHKKDYSMASYVNEAGKVFNIDPLLITALINSETGFSLSAKHNHPEVFGLGGIHTRYWDIPNNTPEEQVYASAYILNYYLDKYGRNEIQALTAYKGWSQLGIIQANKVYLDYKNLQKEIN